MMTKIKKTPTIGRQTGNEPDSVYVLKLVLYLIVGAQWLRFKNAAGTTEIPIPIGLLLGFVFAMHDHFKIDRKIEYALLLAAMLVGFWSLAGVYIRY
jgi:hypothetical protein